nr:carboxylate--amine ligase [Leptospira perolatii]
MEFWSTWRLYLPLVPWVSYLSLRSIRWSSLTSLGFGTIAAGNPGIPLGGLVGESKYEILSKLNSKLSLKFAYLESANDRSVKGVVEQMKKLKLSFPIILKPDAGQRGQGVRLIKSKKDIQEVLSSSNVPLLLQEYHPGPFEAGIFYYRFPFSPRGKIFSITRKVFPKIFGDGKSTLEDLIANHPRFRIQAKVFQERWKDDWNKIPRNSEKLRLAEAGNHCQGTLFLDGSEWITPELEDAIDQISSNFEGFYFGRYDVRFKSLENFKLGKGFKIVELNGITSESTNLYDPRFTKTERYKILFKQWAILFRIGREAISKGAKGAGLFPILGSLWKFYAGDRIVSDLSN